jgi:hypothetical protein
MAHVDFNKKSELVVKLSLGEKFFSLHPSLHVPLSHVVAVSTRPRLPELNDVYEQQFWGTYVPGKLAAGVWRDPDGAVTFCQVRDPERAIAIELEDERWARIIVQIDDESAESAAERIAARLTTRRPEPARA